jgi:hypothetical protein
VLYSKRATLSFHLAGTLRQYFGVLLPGYWIERVGISLQAHSKGTDDRICAIGRIATALLRSDLDSNLSLP